MTYHYRALHVRRSALWDLHEQFRVWGLRCDVCDDDMDFTTWVDAQRAADHHAQKHGAEICTSCGSAPPIRYTEWP